MQVEAGEGEVEGPCVPRRAGDALFRDDLVMATEVAGPGRNALADDDTLVVSGIRHLVHLLDFAVSSEEFGVPGCPMGRRPLRGLSGATGQKQKAEEGD